MKNLCNSCGWAVKVHSDNSRRCIAPLPWEVFPAPKRKPITAESYATVCAAYRPVRNVVKFIPDPHKDVDSIDANGYAVLIKEV